LDDTCLFWSESRQRADLLTIAAIRNVKPAGGVDAAGRSFFGVVGAAIAAAGSGGVSAETLHDGARHASIWSATASNPARATPLAVPKSMLCGRNKCNDFSRFDCAGQPYGDLDRNGGKPDVIRCPPHFDEAGFIEYPQVNWSCTSTARGRA
jgi:hypothetical protein